MGLRLDIKKKLSTRSERVKAVSFHPTEPWVLIALYNGQTFIYNHGTQALVKTFEVSDQPVRCAAFISRKNWIIAGCDDMQLRVFNYNTMEKVIAINAHQDYIRGVAVHPTLPYVLTCSDDMTIKLWDWEKHWKCIQTFEGHAHYVMQVVFNPKDTNTFASASLDTTIKVWSIGSAAPNYTLQGHTKGVNTVDYYQGGEKPFLVSGADDMMVKIWDYQNKSCLQTLEGHTQNVSMVCFHPELPIILSGSEDGTVRIWNGNTYRPENTLNYGLDRFWALAYLKGSNDIALGFDEGTIVIQLGREDPAISMDASGKIIMAKHNEILSANVKTLGEETMQDGQRLALSLKDLGACEIYPQTMSHSPNGRFVVVCGDGEWIIYTALACRNKAFGSGLEFCWGTADEFAVRESSTKIQLYKKFERKHILTTPFAADGIFGGKLLGVRSSSFICFYDWESGAMVRRIDVIPKQIFWSESGDYLCICTQEAIFTLRYTASAVAQKLQSGAPIPSDGFEEAFEVINDIADTVHTGCWIGDAFVYTTAQNKLSYIVAGEAGGTLAHFETPLFLLGFMAGENRLYVCDKDLNFMSYNVSLNVMAYQAHIIHRDFAAAQTLLPTIPDKERSKLAKFLEARDEKALALEVSTDPEHRFELAIALKKLDVALAMAKQSDHPTSWRMVGQVAEREWQVPIAIECCRHAADWPSLLLWAVATGDRTLLEEVAEKTTAAGQYHLAFTANLLLTRAEGCINLLQRDKKHAEAAFFARTYAPSHMPKAVAAWKETFNEPTTEGGSGAAVEEKQRQLANTLADPSVNPDAFTDHAYGLFAEAVLQKSYGQTSDAKVYPRWKESTQRDIVAEMKRDMPNGPPPPEAVRQQQQQPPRAPPQTRPPMSPANASPVTTSPSTSQRPPSSGPASVKGQRSEQASPQQLLSSSAPSTASPSSARLFSPPSSVAPPTMEEKSQTSDPFHSLAASDATSPVTQLSSAMPKRESQKPTMVVNDIEDEEDEEDGFDDFAESQESLI